MKDLGDPGFPPPDSAGASLPHRLAAAIGRLQAARDRGGQPGPDAGDWPDLLREAQEAIEHAADALRQWRAMVESTHDAIVAHGLDGRITCWNPGAEQVYGYSAEEATGQSVAVLVPPDRADETLQILERVRQAEQIDHYETVRLRKDGRRVQVSLTVAPLRDMAGRIVGASVISQDITHRLELEARLRQSHAMESIGILAGGMAHNFNNILAVIQGYASLLNLTEGLPASVTDFAQKISNATDRAAALTRQLLIFSQRQEFRRGEVNLNELVQTMAGLFQPILGEDITLRVSCAPGLPLIPADAARLEQALLNLALNARDAMPQGGQLFITTEPVKIDQEYVRQNPEAVPGEHVRLQVSDSGRGIAAEQLPHVFDPFYTTKEVGQGTGLGLAIVYGIVKQHRGWITVESTPGKGTTFNLFLPSLGVKAAAPAGTEAAAPATLTGTETVLLVEDEFSLRGPLRGILEQHGYHVLEAGSGLEALAVWKQHPRAIDLVLTDMVMPDGMSGSDLVETLRIDDPTVKVIYTSGYSIDAVGKNLSLQEGINFLQKPYHADQLIQTVRRALDAR